MYYDGDPRNVLWSWYNERAAFPRNHVFYNQPLSLMPEQVKAILEVRICRAKFESDSGLVVHCLEREGHDFMHRAGFSWTGCRSFVVRYTNRHVCILNENHTGLHDFGGKGVNYATPRDVEKGSS